MQGSYRQNKLFNKFRAELPISAEESALYALKNVQGKLVWAEDYNEKKVYGMLLDQRDIELLSSYLTTLSDHEQLPALLNTFYEDLIEQNARTVATPIEAKDASPSAT